MAGGVAVTEHPDPGEVVWCDGTGVTSTPGPTGSDLPPGASWVDYALGPMTGEALHAAAEDLAGHLARLGPSVQVASRLIAAAPAPGEET